MQSAINYARGLVRLVITGDFPERAVNLAAQARLTFWAVERGEDNLRLTLLRRDVKQMEALAQRAGCTTRVETRSGLPDFLMRFRHRYAFIVGLTLSVLTVCLCSNFILSIEVSGNDRVPTAVILSQLRGEGLHPGVYGPGLDTRQIALNTQLALPEIAWLTVNLHGTRAQVLVREVVEPPPLTQRDASGDVTARAGGLVLHVDPVTGQAQVSPGDMVDRGDVLISGTVEMTGPEYSDVPTRFLRVLADGKVYARTWRTVSATIPTTAYVKEYTGRRAWRWSLIFFDRRVKLYANGSIVWPEYDKISTSYPITLPGGRVLPICLERQRLAQWNAKLVQVDTDAAQDLLQRRLTVLLNEQMGEEGEVRHVAWSARIDNGLLTVTGAAECEEQIGVQTPDNKENEHQ